MRNSPIESCPPSVGPRYVARYDYTRDGVVVDQVVRTRDKRFKHRHPNGQGGWIWGQSDAAKGLPYRLEEARQAIIEGNTLCFAEGEKDVECLRRLGFVATCNANGAEKWTDLHTQTLLADLPDVDPSSIDAVIFRDNDEAGSRHVAKLVRSLRQAGMRPRVAQMAGLPAGGDISDWVVGRTEQDVQKLLADAVEPEAGDQRDGGDAKKPALSQATLLANLASEATLWRTPGADGEAWMTVAIDGHAEHWRIKSMRVRRWLAERYYTAYEAVAGAQPIQDAIGVLEGRALWQGEAHPVHTRLAAHEGKYYLDLGDPSWQAVEISAQGWQVVADPPVKFRRTRGMLPLQVPTRGGSLRDLRTLLNVGKADWPLVVGWLLAALRPTGPYPVLVAQGEHGSSKSTLQRFLRALIDPNTAPLRAEPKEGRDLMIAATNGWAIALDNLSHIQPWLSDALCRLSTGGGFSTRQLYEDGEEIIFEAKRPVLLNGIEELATRPDLADRAIVCTLPVISEQERQRESAIDAEFEAKRPGILGTLLDAVSGAMTHVDTVVLDRLPRMADFAVWVTAAEPALGWEKETFLRAYARNRADANEATLDAAIIVSPLRLLLARHGYQWEGTATDLLIALNDLTAEPVKRARNWPSNARLLSSALRRIAPNLRQAGITVTFPTSHKKERKIIIKQPPPKKLGPRSEQVGKTSSPASPGPKTQALRGDDEGDAEGSGGRRTLQGGRKPFPYRPHVSAGKHREIDAWDAGDAKIPASSNGHKIVVAHRKNKGRFALVDSLRRNGRPPQEELDTNNNMWDRYTPPSL